jgi:hypothetical protein
MNLGSTYTSNESYGNRPLQFLLGASVKCLVALTLLGKSIPRLGRSGNDVEQRPEGYQHLEGARRKPLVMEGIGLESLPGRWD